MNAWPDPDRAVIARYLGTLRLRSTNSRSYYRRVLHGFQDVAERHPAIDRHMLEVWLREWGTCWYPSTLLQRAHIVDRFLDHLVERELIASNPIAVLRGEYSVKQSRPIWQALMSLRPDHALAALRRPKPFGSVLGEIMRDHVALMRGRGYRYATQAACFLRFDRFLQAHPELACEPVAVMLEHWAAAKRTGNHAAECEKLKRIWPRPCAIWTRAFRCGDQTHGRKRKWRGNIGNRISTAPPMCGACSISRGHTHPRVRRCGR